MSDRECLLSAPPVYRRLLYGGEEALRLTKRDIWFLTGLAATLWLARALLGAWSDAWWSVLLCWSTSLAAATALATFAAYWVGRRMAVLTGVVLLCMHLTPPAQNYLSLLASTTVVAAMTAFAWANASNVRRIDQIQWTRLGFAAAAALGFMLAGPIMPASVVVGCLMFLFVSQDSRGLQFLLHPAVVAVFLGSAIVSLLALATPACPAWLALWQHQWPQLGWFSGQAAGTGSERIGPVALAGSLFAWSPAVVVAILAGIRLGYFSTPIWRLVACWTAGAVVVAAMADRPWLAALTPAVALLAAGGILEIAAWWRRLRSRAAGWRWTAS